MQSMFFFEKALRISCLAVAFLLVITPLSAEETLQEQLKRHQTLEDVFKEEQLKQKLVDYPAEVKNKNDDSKYNKNKWYNLTNDQQTKLIRRKKLRAYPVCWSFDKFTSASAAIPFYESPAQGCTFLLIESSVRHAGGKYSDGHPTIVFPNEVFPMRLLKDKKKLAKALDVEDNKMVYCLLVAQCSAVSLKEFYIANFEVILNDKMKSIKKQLKNISRKKDNKQEINNDDGDEAESAADEKAETLKNNNPVVKDEVYIIPRNQAKEIVKESSANWIWSPRNFSEDKSVCYVAKEFSAKRGLNGSLRMVVDDDSFVFLNGKLICTTQGWSNLYSINLSPYLKKGKNQLIIQGINGKGGCGILAELNIDGQVFLSDETWLSAPAKQKEAILPESLKGFEPVHIISRKW